MTFVIVSLFLVWGISISASDFHTTKVQPGEDVTLQCTNNSKMDSMTFWFRLVNSTTVRYISCLLTSKSEATYSDGFQNGEFEMTTNISTVFLKIKRVDQSDSGLYFCGFHSAGRLLFSVTRLNVGGKIILLYTNLNAESDAMNYAALSFHTRTKMRRPAPQRELERNVLYAATR
ncbi:sentrin-specific protease 8 [Sarotherodon galilaeus]